MALMIGAMVIALVAIISLRSRTRPVERAPVKTRVHIETGPEHAQGNPAPAVETPAARTVEPRPVVTPSGEPVVPVLPPPVVPPVPPVVTPVPVPAEQQPASSAVARPFVVEGPGIYGRVRFEGPPPKPKKLKTEADPKCAEMHADEPLLSEEIVVNSDGTLRWVFVYVKTGLAGVYERPREPVVLDQKGCQYHPHVLGMMAKQPIKMRNSDETSHNIHALPVNSAEWNIGQPNKGMETVKTFPAAEVMVKIKCDVHPWMATYIGVLDHPFYSVTGEDGVFALKGLPAGEYEIEAWHEKFGAQSVKVKLGEGEAKEIAFSYRAAE